MTMSEHVVQDDVIDVSSMRKSTERYYSEFTRLDAMHRVRACLAACRLHLHV